MKAAKILQSSRWLKLYHLKILIPSINHFRLRIYVSILRINYQKSSHMENIAELIIFNNLLYKISFKTFQKYSSPKTEERKNVLLIQPTWHGGFPRDGVWRGHQGRGADDGGSSGLAGCHGGLAHTHCLLPRSFHDRTDSRRWTGSCSFRLLTHRAKNGRN